MKAFTEVRSFTARRNTDVGEIPADWVVRDLGSLTDPQRPISYGIVQTGPQIPNGVRCLRVLDIENGRVNTRDLITTSKAISDSYKRTQLELGDLVMPLRGKVGDVAVVGRDLTGANLTRGVGLIAVKAETCGSFVMQVIRSPASRSRLANSMNGSALQEVPIATLRAFKIALAPTRAEQEAIAEVLSDADALIESLEQVLAKKRQIKQGAMQELLTGKRRLSGFEGKWELRSLDAIGECVAGLTYAPPDVSSSGLLVLRASNVFDGRLRLDDNVYVAMDVPDRVFVVPGDILICVRNGSRDLIGKCARIDERARGMVFGAFMTVFRTPNHEFVYHQFQAADIKRQINEHLGATINQITNKSLRSFTIPFPCDAAEAHAIAAVLSDMDTEIGALEEKLDKAHGIKQGMMQELLTGRIRLIQ
jgi:type I restriction enzyme, S subunit